MRKRRRKGKGDNGTRYSSDRAQARAKTPSGNRRVQTSKPHIKQARCKPRVKAPSNHARVLSVVFYFFFFLFATWPIVVFSSSFCWRRFIEFYFNACSFLFPRSSYEVPLSSFICPLSFSASPPLFLRPCYFLFPLCLITRQTFAVSLHTRPIIAPSLSL